MTCTETDEDQTLLRSLLNKIFYRNKTSPEANLDSPKIFQNLRHFIDSTVEDIMVPRSKVFAVPMSITSNELISQLKQNKYTRVPIYTTNLDDIIGFIHTKDVFSLLQDHLSIKDIIRRITFVPASMKCLTLLRRMQMSHIHAAVVVDEYGGTDGLVTMSDLLEEIVGKMNDEHDIEPESECVEIEEGKYEVEAKISISDLAKKLGIKIAEDDEYDTLSGLILKIAGRVPATGEVLTYENNLRFTIKEAGPRAIYRVLVEKISSKDVARVQDGS